MSVPETGSLDASIATGPWPQRTGLRARLAIARHARAGRRCSRAAPWDQLARGLVTVPRFDDP